MYIWARIELIWNLQGSVLMAKTGDINGEKGQFESRIMVILGTVLTWRRSNNDNSNCHSVQ